MPAVPLDFDVFSRYIIRTRCEHAHSVLVLTHFGPLPTSKTVTLNLTSSGIMALLELFAAAFPAYFASLPLEVVLSTLVASFRYERSKTPIVWNFAGVTFPSSDKDSRTPEMYLKVSLA